MNQRKLNILISNDDGVFAQGVRTLAHTFSRAGHHVTVVCPDRERSATGHGLTLHQPLRAEEIQGLFDPEVTVWSCSGTPADCMKFALNALLAESPDFVLSGINHGPNLGTDVLYSGTVSAAMEGLLDGIMSVAFSLTSFTSREFQPGADFALGFVEELAQGDRFTPTLFNVNIPAVPAAALQGVEVTRQAIRRYVDTFEKRVDPRGKVYYWLAGEAVEDIEPPFSEGAIAGLRTDVEAVKNQWISVTPLECQLMDLENLAAAKAFNRSFSKATS